MSSFLDNFWKTYSLEARQQSSKSILEKYPDKIPLIVYPDNKKGVPGIFKNKFLISKDITLGRVMVEIRKNLILKDENSNKAIFLFINNELIIASKNLGEIYATHCNEDGFLYICYCDENTFGKK